MDVNKQEFNPVSGDTSPAKLDLKKESSEPSIEPEDQHAVMPKSDPLEDEDILKIDRLQLINASARYQLLSANQQLLDFHLSRIM